MALGGTANLSIVITALDKASATFKKMGNNLAATGAKMKSVGKGMTMGLTLPLVGAGVAAGKLSMDFEKSMSNISTLIDTTTEDMGAMKKEVLDLSKKVPVALSDLTESLYDIRSAGIDAGDAMDVLKTSAILAVDGLGTTKEATNLLTSAINVYGDESHDATRLGEILFSTVKAGKTTIAELSQGFGKVAAIAKETGISIEDLSAATAILTTTGIKASEAQVALKAMISNVLKPTTDATDAAEKLGIQFDLGALQSKGLAGMLMEIAEKAGTDKQALADLFGSVEAANAIFALTSEEGGAKLDKVLEDIANSSGVLDETFKKQSETAAAQAQIIKNQLNAALIQLGNVILPMIIPIVKQFTEFVAKLSERFAELSPTTKKMIIIVLGLVAALGPLLIVIGMILPALPLLAAAFSPLGLAIAGIIVVVGLLIKIGWMLYHDWDLIVEGYKLMVVEGFTAIKNFFANIWEGIKGIFGSAIGWITDKIDGLLSIIEKVKAAPARMKEKIGGAVSGIGETVGGWFSNIPHFQEGGIVPGVGAKLAVVHGGETIIPRGKGLGGGINIYIQGGNYLDREAGEKFAEILGKMLRKELRYQKGY